MIAQSAKNETVRIFKSDFLEFFTHIHPATPLFGFTVPIFYFLIAAVHSVSAPYAVAAFLFGLFTWTVFEYFLHRYVFHRDFKSALGKKAHFLLHGVHHAYPQDATRLVIPLAVSGTLAVLFYFPYRFFFGAYHEGVFAGLLAGYVAYDSFHYAAHHWKSKNRVFTFLKQYHLKHHFAEPNARYGVLLPFWDHVFGTVPK